MKKTALFTLIASLSIPAFSADWTPVFKSWEKAETDKTGILNKITQNSYKFSDDYSTAFLTENAKAGRYPNVPKPYSLDLLPAQIEVNTADGYVGLTYPLQNATLYGLPLKSYTQYLGLENGIHMNVVTFGNLTAEQYQQLKNKKFKRASGGECTDYIQTKVETNQQGEITLALDTSC